MLWCGFALLAFDFGRNCKEQARPTLPLGANDLDLVRHPVWLLNFGSDSNEPCESLSSDCSVVQGPLVRHGGSTVGAMTDSLAFRLTGMAFGSGFLLRSLARNSSFFLRGKADH